MEYNFRDIEKKWKKWWEENKVYHVSNESSRPKCYVLDMFPYPSGAGLHVGHPLGYIASDIYSRYKRLMGFNVLHPMGYDAFGLPAEQYAIDHGIHPAVSTENNINNFRNQLDNIGFCFDWDREIRTSDPQYYKWTQWIFLQLFSSYFCHTEKKALPISLLIKKYETKGAMPKSGEPVPGKHFTAAQWNSFSEKEKSEILMRRRLAYCGYGEVNWCEALGTVLANDEIINGVSERGGYPVVKKTLRQWYMRITEYADRLLEGLEKVDYSESMKEMQSNWIGKSEGAEIKFQVRSRESGVGLRVYTTRPDTIFGVDFMVLAPEHELVEKITTTEQKHAVDEYISYVKSRNERERMAEKKITGVFTGAYALNPLNGREIPVWISEYVLAGYGTGAIMGVPCGDERDHKFAKHFNIPITNIIGDYYNGEEANPTYDAKLQNSDFLNGIEMRKAIDIVISQLELAGVGKRKVNYKMRDAVFSRQRYWGEPIPITWKDGIAFPLEEKELPVLLPGMDVIKPGPDGEGPLSNLIEWKNYKGRVREVNTMPGYAGSSWYFLRYMDPDNEKTFCDRKVSDYWGQVDIYVGGTEHAVGHLLYSRMWTKVLYDLNLIGFDEPYKRLVNQGMIQGVSALAKSIAIRKDNGEIIRLIIPNETRPKTKNEIIQHRIPVQYVEVLNNQPIITKESFLKLKGEYQSLYGDWEFCTIENYKNSVEYDIGFFEEESLISNLKDNYVTLDAVVEKMSKSKYNVVNPDDIIEKYGADTFRMYEMFLGPLEMSKPWDTKGIEGVHRFLKKFWRIFMDENKGQILTNDAPDDEELKILHRAIKKVGDDTEKFNFNTAVSAFMIATNELTDLKCHKRAILEPLLILLAPYAPHISEELWHVLGNKGSVVDANYPVFNEEYTRELSKNYPVAINGKTRTELTIALSADQKQVEEMVLANDIVKKWLDGKQPKKVIYVKNKMINVVI